MIIGIDACNIRFGGGLTHLVELLNALDYDSENIEKIIVWSNQHTINKLIVHHKVEYKTNIFLNSSTFFCFLYQFIFLGKSLKKNCCDISLVPGGIFLSSFTPFVPISQNLLPFDPHEINRFQSRIDRLKFWTIRQLQIFTFKRAAGIIFLTKYAFNQINKFVKVNNYTIIPHGINPVFFKKPKIQDLIESFSLKNPFELTYVSVINAYKHQDKVAHATINLLKKGYPVKLNLIGKIAKNEGLQLKKILENNSQYSNFIEIKGNIDHDKIFEVYQKANGFIFASSCENLPLILIEAMAAGQPILSSNRGPMPEVLGQNGGFYFDPENVSDLENKLIEFLNNHHSRALISSESYNLSLKYSWKFTASQYTSYLDKVILDHKLICNKID